MTAVSSFDVTGWDETPTSAPAEGPRLSRASVRKVFRGDLDGESVAEVLLCQSDPAESGAGFVASEVVTGRIDGREGTFVMQHGGLMGGGEPPRTFGSIVPGSTPPMSPPCCITNVPSRPSIRDRKSVV